MSDIDEKIAAGEEQEQLQETAAQEQKLQAQGKTQETAEEQPAQATAKPAVEASTFTEKLEEQTAQAQKTVTEQTVQAIAQTPKLAETTIAPREIRLKEIREQIEEAKDPTVYETYQYSVSVADEKIHLFTARRIGENHKENQTPCQDYCLTASVDGCTVLADADGLSSCMHSDIGSKLACEAVVSAVESATKTCNDDERELVRRLLSVGFRDRLVSIWVKNVLDDIAQKSNPSISLSPKEQLEEFYKYASTLMFAVLTKNWIVTGNLGDGQILVFNDSYGVKLRIHAPKNDTSTSSLFSERCVRENFIVAKFPRISFNGVLLTTDGIYDSLNKDNLLFDYAKQAKARFFSSDRLEPEPYQAFCYQEKGETYKDFSRTLTQDDCSIVLAVENTDLKPKDYTDAIAGMEQHADACTFNRWAAGCLSFYTKKGDEYDDIMVSDKENNLNLADVKSVVFETPTETWTENGLYFSKYTHTQLPTLEWMHRSGALRRDNADPVASDRRTITVFLQLKNLQKELSARGLAFAPAALFNLFYDGEKLHVRKEAWQQAGQAATSSGDADVEKVCFRHLLGILTSGDTKMPIFDIGPRGTIVSYRAGKPEEKLLQLERKGKKIYFKNVGSFSWMSEPGVIARTGAYLEMKDNMHFVLLDCHGEKLETYHYIAKERL